MTQGFPTYTSAARKGDRGVDLVSRIVNEGFGWLFRRNHQEHDFGIDAQIDVVLEDGSVTGQMIAMQIKYGASFFNEKNQWGYVYRGEQKHFNYLANYPTPVLIVICHPKSEDCYWVVFDPTATSKAGSNWKITVPFENKLANSKKQIIDLLPEPADYLSEVEAYWAMNDILVEHEHFLFIIDREEIEAFDVTRVRSFFDRLRSTPEIAVHCQGKVELAFHGYNEDPRELFEIQDVRNYVPLLSAALPELFFFARTGERASTLKTLAMCLTEVKIKSSTPNEQDQLEVEVATHPIAEFLERHYPGLNEMTDWLNMPIEENKRISFEVAEALGMKEAEG